MTFPESNQNGYPPEPEEPEPVAHTPGPWTTNARGASEVQHVTAWPSRKTVAQVWDYPEAEANARLIASAPDLLATLEAVLEWDRDTERDGLGVEIGERVKAAIEKAKGART